MLRYPELGISISLAGGKDSTEDVITFTAANRTFKVANRLSHIPEGLEAFSGTLGIKKSGRADFTVITVSKPCPAAGVFTKSLTASPTIERNRRVLEDGLLQGIAVNSGNANVFTPSAALDLARTAELISQEFEIPDNRLAICSTGVIGVALPMEKFESGVPKFRSHAARGLQHSSEAILTTDIAPKTASVKIDDLIVCGIAKGAGMIEPNMATMLVYLFVNADVDSKTLRSWLLEAVDASFNSISIDSDTSTSDSVILLSTAETKVDKNGEAVCREALKAICVKLARDILSQGEGVTKLIECTVETDISLDFSRRLAKKVINSPLLKAAIHGGDPNWGRIVAALGKPQDGYDDDPLAPDQVRISVSGTVVFDRLKPVEFDRAALTAKLQKATAVPIEIVLGQGGFLKRVWGTDLTEEYVTLNAEYTT